MRGMLPLLLILPAMALLAAPAPAPPSTLTFPGQDGTPLEGRYYPPPARQAPAVICMHGLGRGPEVWEGIALKLQAEGYAVFALTLRGHPERPRQRGQPHRSWLDMDLQEFKGMVKDVAAARACLVKQREVDMSRLAVLGEEFGANLGLAASADPAFKAAVLLSPREDARGLRLAEALEAVPGRPCLVAASAEDEQGAAVVGALAGSAREGLETVLLPEDPSSGDFGAGLLADPAKAALAERVVTWLKAALPVRGNAP